MLHQRDKPNQLFIFSSLQRQTFATQCELFRCWFNEMGRQPSHSKICLFFSWVDIKYESTSSKLLNKKAVLVKWMEIDVVPSSQSEFGSRSTNEQMLTYSMEYNLKDISPSGKFHFYDFTIALYFLWMEEVSNVVRLQRK